ncbi:hypothetical protein ABZ383_00220 [Streptomyces sp. NPDC005900]|uniref:hypothetical protein n=1 Tax=Streptomyces sp. NPDC005900 TaxID=3154569 RepID=UPI0033EC3243
MAAVARAETVATIGIDTEPNEPLRTRTLAADRECRAPCYRRWLSDIRTLDGSVRFNAKGSVFMPWYPLTGQWLDFHVMVTIDPIAGTFTVRLLGPGPVVNGDRLHGFDVLWMVGNGLL